MTIIRQIKRYMKLQGVSQVDLAKRLGVTEATVSRWMLGVREPSLTRLEEILKVLGLKVCVFM